MRINSISNLQNQLNIVKSIILCGAGRYAKVMTDYLKCIDQKHKIMCFSVGNRMDNPPEYCGFPVFSFSSLRHMSNDATFIIAVRDEIKHELYNETKNIGVDDFHILELSDSLFVEIENNQMAKSDSYTIDLISSITKRFDQVCRLVEMQEEIAFVNKKAFDGMQSCFKDRDVVVVGTGPTLSKYRPIENAVHIGVNGAWKHKDIQLDYYFIQDGDRRCIDSTSEGLRAGLKGVKKIFIGKFLPSNNNWYYRFPENYFEIDERIIPFYSGGLREDLYRGNVIHTDIRFHPLMEFGSVIFPAIHFALYTHPRKIFFVGCDTTLPGKAGGHFYETNILDNDGKINYDRGVQLGYAAVHDFASFNYPDTELISINPVGLKGLFNDEYTE